MSKDILTELIVNQIYVGAFHSEKFIKMVYGKDYSKIDIDKNDYIETIYNQLNTEIKNE